VKQISAAFVKAQRAFGPALKTNTNPAFRSKYADLSACVEAVIDALHQHGIALMQKTEPSERGVKIQTVLIHESGETIDSGWLEVPASKQDPQGYGSALTYARRYSLMAACGIAPEDDDGNAASKPKPDLRIAPAKEVADRLPITAEQKARVERVGADIVSAWLDDQQLAVLEAWRSLTDNDEKAHLWHWLASESKIRAFIKANGREQA
jgi:hypothetical protein